ncbi:NXPE family member 3-like [Saccoglossus kowalevskii]|uniref:NXPE family member 3-like n=1 Tax=Saccoglossus kowalevskii TaxID=10224 RepID=A0ABM0MJ34_SACKO|nr:PREDICTED: NXPE family member 3-like [Saccoglossus kowalevskii]
MPITDKTNIISSMDQDHNRSFNTLFPYIDYNRFGMEWVNIVDELEWINSHNKVDTRNYEVPFAIEIGTLGQTSVFKTRATLCSKKIIYKGSYICISIVTFDDNGRPRNRGGDFFSARMSNDILQKSTAGRILDHGNGTYSVYFYAAWSGTARITIALTFVREFINYLKDALKTKEQLMEFTGTYIDGNITETTTCHLINEGIWSGMCEYTNRNAMGKTVLVCHKPVHVDCSKLYSTKISGKRLDLLAEEEIARTKTLFDRKTDRVLLEGMPMNLTIHDSPIYLSKLPICGPDLPIPLSDGYWANNRTYISMVCRSQQWTQEQFDKCAANKKFVASGDSALREFIGVFSEFQGHFDFHFMTPRIAGPIVTIWEPMFESDIIDNITQSECQSHNYVVILNFCFHYGAWSTRSFVERLVQVKLSVERLMKRCRNPKIIVKMSHSRDNVYMEQTIHSSNWSFYDMNRIIRRVFGGIGVHFLDVWDMVISSFYNITVHMDIHVVRQEFYLMLSYICPELVDSEIYSENN